MDNAKELLTKARALLEKGWTQGFLCRDSNGDQVYPSQDIHSVCTVCLMGALAVPYYQEPGIPVLGPVYHQVLNLVSNVIFGHSDGLIATWNDAPGRTKEEVLAVVDKALDLCDPEETSEDIYGVTHE